VICCAKGAEHDQPHHRDGGCGLGNGRRLVLLFPHAYPPPMDWTTILWGVVAALVVLAVRHALAPHETETERQQRLGRKLLGLDR